MGFDEIKWLPNEGMQAEIDEVNKVIDMDYPFENVFVGIDYTFIDLKPIFVFQILLLGVVMKTNLSGTLEKSLAFLTVN